LNNSSSHDGNKCSNTTTTTTTNEKNQQEEKTQQQQPNKKSPPPQKQQPEVCRAYHKLHEAFERYFHPPTRSCIFDAKNSIIPDSDGKEKNTLDIRNNNDTAKRKQRFPFTSSSIALDVGAAPGGWTMYLKEQIGCSRIYAIDPATLSPILLDKQQQQHEEGKEGTSKKQVVIHIDKQIKDALPSLQMYMSNNSSSKEEDEVTNVVDATPSSLSSSSQQPTQTKETIPSSLTTTNNNTTISPPSPSLINIYVSDMCLNEMSQQLQYLLNIKTKWNILKPNTFFVVTLKCNTGHSRQAFDEQVKDVVTKFFGDHDEKDGAMKKNEEEKRKEEEKDVNTSVVVKEKEEVIRLDAYGVQIFHLFSNRKGERTVMGYLR